MTLNKSKTFLLFCLSFIAGVFAGKFLNLQLMMIFAILFIIIITLGFTNKKAFILGMAGIIGLAGAFRFQSVNQQNDLSEFYGQKVSGVGVIVQEPDQRSDKTFLTLGNLHINDQELDSKILLSVGRFPEYEYGQKISFNGKVQEPLESEEFSYKNYLSRFGIDAISYFPKIQVVEEKQGWKVKYYLLKFKKLFVTRLAEVLPEPQNAFLAGLLVGLRRTIPEDLTEALARTGTTHVIAISGFNITIIATVLDGIFLRFFQRRISFVLAMLAIAGFVLMAGASASAVRAGIMGVLGMLALNLGRVNSINNALALTASLMLLINPQILVFDIGFQLSFLALLGLVFLSPIISFYLYRIPKLINTYLVPSIAAYIATLPVLLYNFDQFSLIAIPTNVLIAPMIPIAMLFGFITGGVGLVSVDLAKPVAFLAYGALTYVLNIIQTTAAWPFGSFNFHLSFIWVLVYYSVLVILIYKWKQKQENF